MVVLVTLRNMHRLIILEFLTLIVIIHQTEDVHATKPQLMCGIRKYLGRKSEFGYAEVRVMSAIECADLCLKDYRCQAADFNAETNYCTKHEDLQGMQDADMYVWLEKICSPSGCHDSFDSLLMLEKTANRKYIADKDEAGCRKICLSKPRCYQFDVFTKPKKKCFIYEGDEEKVPIRERIFNAFFRIRCIGNLTAPEKPAPPPGAAPTVIPEEKKAYICAMYEYDGFTIDGGQAVGAVKNERECASLCTKQHSCVAATYTAKEKSCKLVRIQQAAKTKRLSKGTVVYEKVCQRGGCRHRFVKLPDRLPPYGKPAVEAKTIEQCEKVCLNQTCYGFSFRKKGGALCSLHDQPILNNPMLSNGDFDTFARIKCFNPHYGCQVDVIFLVDSSGSIRDTNIPGQPTNWFMMGRFLQEVIRDVHQIKGSDARFSLITFSTEAYFQFDFTKYANRYDELLQAVVHLPFVGSHTNTSGALRMADRQLVGNATAGDRPDVSDVIVLVTDGESTKDPHLLEPAAIKLRSKNVRIMCVGVTSKVTNATIQKVISSPHDYFRARNFLELSRAASSISGMICHY